MFKKFILSFAILFSVLSTNANALLITLDFTSLNSSDLWGNETDDFNVASYFDTSQTQDLIDAIVAAVENDFYSTAYSFIASNQQLDIDFMVATIGTDVSSIDSDNYAIQIGSVTSYGSSSYNGTLGLACDSCVVSQTVLAGSVVGSVFSNNILSGLYSVTVDGWDFEEIVNAIAGTLSHEIAHTLGLDHPTGTAANPGESAYGLMATGASPTSMPNGERLLDRAFSDTNMQTLVDNLGLRTVEVNSPGTWLLMLMAVVFMAQRRMRRA